MELIIVWFALCAVVGYVASQKGRSGVGWFLLAFVISPLLAGILILVIGPGQVGTVVPTNIGDELFKFASLRDSGAITGEEFETQKARLPPPSLCGVRS